MTTLLTNVQVNIRTDKDEDIFHRPIDMKQVVGTELAFVKYLKKNNVHISPQGYFTYVDNLKGSFLHTFGLHTCHSILIFRDGGPALLSHIDNDSILCPIFILSKLLEWIKYFGSKFNVLFIEPDVDGVKKTRFSYQRVFDFFSWFKRVNNLDLIVARLLLPPVSEQYGGNSVSLYEQSGKTYLVVVHIYDELSFRLGSAVIKKIGGNVTSKWELDCGGDSKLDFGDDIMFSCPVQDRYTRGVIGTNLIEADISDILEYIDSKMSEDDQIRIGNKSKKYISESLKQILIFSAEKKLEEVKIFKLVTKYMSNMKLTKDNSTPIRHLYKSICESNIKRKGYSTDSLSHRVFKLIEEINLHLFASIMRIGVDKK